MVQYENVFFLLKLFAYSFEYFASLMTIFYASNTATVHDKASYHDEKGIII
jgi:hypothetical protein